jgi:hypothetical protein
MRLQASWQQPCTESLHPYPPMMATVADGTLRPGLVIDLADADRALAAMDRPAEGGRDDGDQAEPRSGRADAVMQVRTVVPVMRSISGLPRRWGATQSHPADPGPRLRRHHLPPNLYRI